MLLTRQEEWYKQCRWRKPDRNVRSWYQKVNSNSTIGLDMWLTSTSSVWLRTTESRISLQYRKHITTNLSHLMSSTLNNGTWKHSTSKLTDRESPCKGYDNWLNQACCAFKPLQLQWYKLIERYSVHTELKKEYTGIKYKLKQKISERVVGSLWISIQTKPVLCHLASIPLPIYTTSQFSLCHFLFNVL